MDQPSTIRCFACGAALGLSCDAEDFYTCACGRRVRPHGAEGFTREVTPEYLSLLQELRALEEDFEEDSRAFTLSAGASRTSAGTRVPPSQANAGCQAALGFLTLGGLGVFVILHGGTVYGSLLILAGIAVFVYLKKDTKRRIEGYRVLKADYDRRRAALQERLWQS